MSRGKEEIAATPTKFGTFGGVFTPCVLTILGVIMFLRFGHVVGQAGIWRAVAIVLIAKSITLLTTLSLSAIATNTRVKGGGAYFLISRSLGVEYGGAIGIVFFLAQAVSVAMYVIGFAEACAESFPALGYSQRSIATSANVIVFVCVFIGAGWTVKLQYGILGLLIASLVSFFAGAFPQVSAAQLHSNLGPGFLQNDNFFTMFALFFPAVTGIMAGANMSGDLEDPGKSIPRGTLLAVAVTGVIYIGMAVLLGSAVGRDDMTTNSLVVKQLAWSPMLITAGVFAATISSAMGSMMGAPRILQALARDNIFRRLRFFAVGSGGNSEPRRATVVTFVIAQICIMLGDLNAIAPIITMFFMITYGTLNLATFYESITNNPSYRPRFRYCHWSTALLGAIGCFAVMFLISPVWAAVAMLLMIGLHKFVGLLSIKAGWGDVQSGVLFERTRRNLLRLEQQFYHPKNWRPTILALTGAGGNRNHLAVYGHWLTSGHGILSLAQIITGEVKDLLERRRNQEDLLRKFIRDEQLDAFPTVIVAPLLSDGVESLVQCHGLGGMKPNTLLLGWPTDPEKVAAFGSILRVVAGLGCSMVSIHVDDDETDPWMPASGPIDVYWRGKENGGLMLLMAHLLLQNPPWRSHEIRLIRVIPNEAGRDEVMSHLEELIIASRIAATPVVVVYENVVDVVHHTSANSAAVFLGFTSPEEGREIEFHQSVETLIGPLHRVVLVWSGGGMALT